LTRRWSAFTGATSELHTIGKRDDWLTAKSPELHIDYGERPIAIPDLGDIAWSEAVSQQGASIRLEAAAPCIHVRLETFLSNHRPGMVRSLEITNTGSETTSLSRVAAEVLPMDPAQVQPVEAAPLEVPFEGAPHFYRVLGGDAGAVWLGGPQPEGFALFHPNPKFCATVWTGNQPLAPGQTWKAPPATVLLATTADAAHVLPAMNHLHAEWSEHVQSDAGGNAGDDDPALSF
jgi:hypothetical protein